MAFLTIFRKIQKYMSPFGVLVHITSEKVIREYFLQQQKGADK